MGRRAALRLALQRRCAAPSSRLLAGPLGPLAPRPLRAFLLEARVHHAMARNDDRTALADLQTLARRHGRHGLVHRLLFRRGFRPKDPAAQRRLLWGVAEDEDFDPQHRAYALISLVYRSLKDGDVAQADRLVPAIEAMAERLERDPGTLHCQQRNRDNGAKLLISCYASLLHLQLLRGDGRQVAAIGGRGVALAERIDYDQLPADVAFRLTTNFGRVLSVAALDAWRRRDEAALDRALAALDGLRRQAHDPRHAGSGAQENHRRFVDGMVEAIRSLPPAGTPRQEPALAADRLLTVATPLLAERWAGFLAPDREPSS
jgi:hypothetical protein